MPVASKDCQIFASCSACEPRTSPGRKLPVWAIRLQFASRQTPHTPRPGNPPNMTSFEVFFLCRWLAKIDKSLPLLSMADPVPNKLYLNPQTNLSSYMSRSEPKPCEARAARPFASNPSACSLITHPSSVHQKKKQAKTYFFLSFKTNS